MSRSKKTILVEWPILPGSISVAESQCGKLNCACKEDPPKLHGPYYRWTGKVDGKRTTKTISKEEAKECKRRIKNYKKLQEEIALLLDEALRNSPWES